MASSTTIGKTTPLLAACVIFVLLGVPRPASADLYKYERDDGSRLITTERRPDLTLVEVISGSSKAPVSTINGESRKATSGSQEEEASEASESDAVRRAREHRAEHKRRTAGQRRDTRPDLPRHDRFNDLISEASAAYDVPEAFIKAVIRVESNFKPDATSHAGAMGLMQLMPDTADYLNVTRPYDPRQNVFGGTKLLRILIDRYDGDINLILSAYNAGDGAVREYNGIPYKQTREYVASVYRFYKLFKSQKEESQ
jgi:hypothetical protein